LTEVRRERNPEGRANVGRALGLVRLSDDQIGKILAESTGVFAKFLTPAGKLEMPIRAYLVMGHKQLL
jgi:hypothetical protein